MSGENAQLGEIERLLLESVPTLDLEQQHVALTLTRLLAAGEPVALERVYEVVGLTPERGEAALAELRSVVRDERGRAVTCCGLSVRETAHLLMVDERRLYTWCAWDVLFLPELLGRTVRATSRCPVSGEQISVELGPGRTPTVCPASAVLSFVLPDPSPTADPYQSFCHFVNFFNSPEAGLEFASDNERVFLLSVEEGYRLGQVVNRACFAAVLPPGG
jgi:alkylmercury lyase